MARVRTVEDLLEVTADKFNEYFDQRDGDLPAMAAEVGLALEETAVLFDWCQMQASRQAQAVLEEASDPIRGMMEAAQYQAGMLHVLSFMAGYIWGRRNVRPNTEGS